MDHAVMEAGRTLAHIIFNDKAAYLSRRALLIPSPRPGGFSAASSCVAEKEEEKSAPACLPDREDAAATPAADHSLPRSTG